MHSNIITLATINYPLMDVASEKKHKKTNPKWFLFLKNVWSNKLNELLQQHLRVRLQQQDWLAILCLLLLSICLFVVLSFLVGLFCTSVFFCLFAATFAGRLQQQWDWLAIHRLLLLPLIFLCLFVLFFCSNIWVETAATGLASIHLQLLTVSLYNQ